MKFAASATEQELALTREALAVLSTADGDLLRSSELRSIHACTLHCAGLNGPVGHPTNGSRIFPPPQPKPSPNKNSYFLPTMILQTDVSILCRRT